MRLHAPAIEAHICFGQRTVVMLRLTSFIDMVIHQGEQRTETLAHMSS